MPSFNWAPSTIQMKERIANSLIWLREWKNMAVKLLAWGVKRNFLLRLHYDLCRTSYDVMRYLIEDDLWWKTTFDGRRPLMKDDLWWKTTFDGRQPLTEDDLWRKTTFDGRRPLMKDDLWRRMTIDGRRPLMEDDWSHTSSRTFPPSYLTLIQPNKSETSWNS